MQEYYNEKTGKWIYRESYLDYLTGERKRVSVSLPNHTRQTRKEAERILSEKIAQTRTAHSDRTLGELFEDYIDHQKQTLKAATWTRNEYTIRPVVDKIGRNALCERLSASVVASALKGYKSTTYNQKLVRMKAMLRWGYENDYLSDVRWIDKMKKLSEKTEREKIADKYLESSDVIKLTQGMIVEQWKLLTLFLVLTGLRVGEASALLVSDIDTRGRVIHVTKTYNESLKTITSTKTLDSTRDIYIQDELLPVLTQIKEWRFHYATGSDIFLPSVGGRKTFSPQTYDKYFRENTERIFGRRLTPHSLRHTHASLCFEKGMSLEAVSMRLGHADSKITREIYLHITEKKKEEFNRQMDAVKLLV